MFKHYRHDADDTDTKPTMDDTACVTISWNFENNVIILLCYGIHIVDA